MEVIGQPGDGLDEVVIFQMHDQINRPTPSNRFGPIEKLPVRDGDDALTRVPFGSTNTRFPGSILEGTFIDVSHGVEFNRTRWCEVGRQNIGATHIELEPVWKHDPGSSALIIGEDLVCLHGLSRLGECPFSRDPATTIYFWRKSWPRDVEKRQEK